MMLDRYDLIPSLPASDLERAKRFYSETLGLKVKQDNPYAVEFHTRSGKFGVYLTESAGKAEHTLGAWEVEDIDVVAEHLRTQGVVFEEYDYPELKTVNGIADMGRERAAWFKDTEGNLLSIVQPARFSKKKD